MNGFRKFGDFGEINVRILASSSSIPPSPSFLHHPWNVHFVFGGNAPNAVVFQSSVWRMAMPSATTGEWDMTYWHENGPEQLLLRIVGEKNDPFAEPIFSLFSCDQKSVSSDPNPRFRRNFASAEGKNFGFHDRGYVCNHINEFVKATFEMGGKPLPESKKSSVGRLILVDKEKFSGQDWKNAWQMKHTRAGKETKVGSFPHPPTYTSSSPFYFKSSQINSGLRREIPCPWRH